MPKQPQDRKTTKKYGGWKKASSHDLKLPSGAVALVKRPGLQGLLKEGILDDLDTLTAVVVTETLPKAEGKTVAGVPALPDPKKLTAALEAMDKIVVYCVQEPTVLPVPAEGEEREDVDEDTYYVDDIDIEDKSLIVAFAMGGSSDLEQFRAGTAPAVGSVPAGT